MAKTNDWIKQQNQEVEDDLQIVIEKLIHALAIVLRRKIHQWIHRKDEEMLENGQDVKKLPETTDQEDYGE